MKRFVRCFAASILTLVITVSVITPFSIAHASEATEDYDFRVLYSINSYNDECYVYADFIFTSYQLCSGEMRIRFLTADTVQSYSPLEGEGIVSTSTGTLTDNNKEYRYIDITFTNTGYWVYRVCFRGSYNFWNQTRLHNPTSAKGITFGAKSTIYGDGIYYSEEYQLRRIAVYLAGIVNSGLDVSSSSIEALLSDITDNQDAIEVILTAMNTNVSDIETLLSDIKALFQTSNNRLSNILQAAQQINSATTSINNHTSTISGYVSQLVNGNNSSNTSASNLNDAVSDASTSFSDLEDLESDFQADFSTSQTQIQTIISQTSLTAFADATIWFTSQLASLFNSTGDMKILVMLPLLLGLALFFIGRAQVVYRTSSDAIEYETHQRASGQTVREVIYKRSGWNKIRGKYGKPFD